MSAKTHNFRIGLFVLAAVALLIIGLLAFGARSYFREVNRGETAIPGDVYGLSIGSGVELRGVPVGKVTSIEFDWSAYPESQSGYIIVEFEVEQDIMSLHSSRDPKKKLEGEVAKGLRASVKNQGITGTSILALEYLNPDRNPPPPIDFTPRYYYIPSAPGQFTRVLESIEKSLRGVEKFDMGGVAQGVTNVLRQVGKLAEKLNQIDLQALATNTDSLLLDLKSTSSSLAVTINEVRETLNGMKLASVGQNADELLSGLRETNVKLQVVLDKVGAVPMQDTVGDLREAVQSLNDVLLELKRYPSGFILGAPPHPAKSVKPSSP